MPWIPAPPPPPGQTAPKASEIIVGIATSPNLSITATVRVLRPSDLASTSVGYATG
jgi:hypothetical protein